MTDGSPLVARRLAKTYGDAQNPTVALDGVDLTIAPGQSVAIMGPSGSGKTTLLHCLAGILAPSGGTVTWRGTELGAMSDAQRTALRRDDFGFVFQSGQLLPELPADENAALPLLLDGTERPHAVARAGQWLGYLGLAGMEQRRPGELSGGQAQRVAIARALVGNPGVVFADEPTGALDRTTGYEVMHALTTATRASGAALVVVTHDVEVARWCSRTISMRDGRIIGEAVQESAGDTRIAQQDQQQAVQAPAVQQQPVQAQPVQAQPVQQPPAPQHQPPAPQPVAPAGSTPWGGQR